MVESWVRTVLNQAIFDDPVDFLNDKLDDLCLGLLEQVRIDSCEEVLWRNLEKSHMVEKDAPKIAAIDCVHVTQVLLEVLC